MSVDVAIVLKQIENALKLIADARRQLWDATPERFKRTRNGAVYFHTLPSSDAAKLCTQLYATIERVAPRGSRYMKNAQALFDRGLLNASAIELAEGILIALRDDYAAGYLQRVEELIHADMFSDFLDRADYFLKGGYKDPAAVIAGSVLEEHLRKLCVKNNIPVIVTSPKGDQPKKADTMNADLARDETVYSKIEQKAVTAWLALRNAAAHGEYSKYTEQEIVLMVRGIRDFLLRHPA